MPLKGSSRARYIKFWLRLKYTRDKLKIWNHWIRRQQSETQATQKEQKHKLSLSIFSQF